MDKPQLTLVDHAYSTEHDIEFEPLPYYPWEERPEGCPLATEECATAIHLAHGSLPAACKLLKVTQTRLKRLVRQVPRLQRILSEALEDAADYAAGRAIDILYDPGANDRRQEWAITKVLQSRCAQGHPLSPAPNLSNQGNASLTMSDGGGRQVTFRWRTSEDDLTSPPSNVAEGDDGAG